MKIAPKIKLSYFELEGRAESMYVYESQGSPRPIVNPDANHFTIELGSRLALTLAGVPFEDHRVKRQDWEEFKKSTPYGQLPIMNIDDGPPRAQSEGMLRWIGTDLCPALYPKDRLLDVEEAMGLVMDAHEARAVSLFLNFCPEMYGHPADWNQTEEGKHIIKIMREKIVSEQLPKFMGYFSAMLRKTGNQWLASTEGPTLADCMAIPLLRSFSLGFMDHVPANCLDDYPDIVRYVKRFCSLPQIVGRYETGLY
jgi:prostaglandin-H2 D-isomerase / glutathione transferase